MAKVREVAIWIVVALVMGSCAKACVTRAAACQFAVADGDYDGTQKYCID